MATTTTQTSSNTHFWQTIASSQVRARWLRFFCTPRNEKVGVEGASDSEAEALVGALNDDGAAANDNDQRASDCFVHCFTGPLARRRKVILEGK